MEELLCATTTWQEYLLPCHFELELTAQEEFLSGKAIGAEQYFKFGTFIIAAQVMQLATENWQPSKKMTPLYYTYITQLPIVGGRQSYCLSLAMHTKL